MRRPGSRTCFGPAFGDLGSDQFAGAGETGADAAGADAGADGGDFGDF